jgi:serine-type D-Ala-D-Ala carboxypeptidase (penicillin-binding protein 5/6)
MVLRFNWLFFCFLILIFSIAHADSLQPMLTPIVPKIDAAGYVLLDTNSGMVLAQSNADQRRAPASLTKIMTSYIISLALKQGQIHLDDSVLISKRAWQTGGSKMFIKVGDHVSVRDLMQGIIVDSGNDASIAMAEHVAGSEDAFVHLMNQQAARLGMTGTHFTDVNGLPDPNHFTTPRDMAILAQALIRDFPQDYRWYSQKWFTYNGIRQPNRNRLLWRNPDVDGIKTGHTQDAGFCLVASAREKNTRLISVIMGAPSDEKRAQDSQKLLTYGFRFFESKKLASATQALANPPVWFGTQPTVSVGVAHDLYVSVPINTLSKRIKTNLNLTNPLRAPIKKGQTLGTIDVVLSDKVLAQTPLIALQEIPKAGFIRSLVDHISLLFQRL